MAYQGDGATGYISHKDSGTGIDASRFTNYSYHFWYKNASAPGSGSNSNPLSIVYKNAGVTYVNISMCWSHTSAAFRQSCHHMNADHTNFTTSKFATTLVANEWYGIGATWDASLLKAYLNGTLDKQVAGSQIDTTVTPFVNLLAYYDGVASAFDGGAIGEFALWEDDLTAAEMYSLGQGCSPLLVRPNKMLLYIPLIRGASMAAGAAIKTPLRQAGGAWTVVANTVSVANHPRIIYPGSQHNCLHIDASNYPAVSETISQSVDFIDSIPDPGPGVSHTLTFTQSLKSNGFSTISQQLSLGSQFRADSGNIASGRIKEKLKTNHP